MYFRSNVIMVFQFFIFLNLSLLDCVLDILFFKAISFRNYAKYVSDYQHRCFHYIEMLLTRCCLKDLSM